MDTPRMSGLHRLPNGLWQAIALIAAVALALLCATHWSRWEGEQARQTTDDAYLESDITALSAKVAGYVRAVPVEDFAQVRAGQVIAELVDDDYRAAVSQAEANLALAQTQVQTLEAQRVLQTSLVGAARDVLAATRADVEQSARDVARSSALMHDGAGSAEAAERAATHRAQLLAVQAQNRAQIDAAERQLGVITSQIAQARSAVAAQRAALDLARINLGYTVIRAPEDGRISQRQIFAGQYLPVGGQVTTLTPLPRIWVVANYRETQLTHVRAGESATITVDTFPDHRLRGHVVALAPASGARFALLPPDNATGNFTKIVQRFGVKIALDEPLRNLAGLLPGMSVIATIDVDSEPRAPGPSPR